jgi:NhaP-type Na+/H+ or K+/H+ antiporter
VIVLLIAVCCFFRSLFKAKKITIIPEIGVCVIIGCFAGAFITSVPHIAFSFDEELFIRFLLPPIVFDASMQINKTAFRKTLGPILTFSTIGTLISTIITACVVHYGSHVGTPYVIPWPESLAFGSLISSIDPVAILSVLDAAGVSKTETLYIAVAGESLLNDGIAIVLFSTVLKYVGEANNEKPFEVLDLISALGDFCLVFFGSAAIGFIIGIACTLYFRLSYGMQSPLIEVISFFAFGFLPYYICDGLNWSGIVAIVVSGIMMDLYAESNLSREAKTHVRFVVELLSTLMETCIFVYLGIFLFTTTYLWDIWLITLAISGCLLSRGIMVTTLSFAINRVPACKCLWRLWRPKRGQAIHLFSQGSSSNSSGNIEQEQQRQRQQQRTTDEGAILGDSLLTAALLSDDENNDTGDSNSYSNNNNEMVRTATTTATAAITTEPKFISTTTMFVLWFGGLRGAMSFALVENIHDYDPILRTGSEFNPELKGMTSAVILFFIFVFGGFTPKLLDELGLRKKRRMIAAPRNTSSSSSVSNENNSPSLMLLHGGEGGGEGIDSIATHEIKDNYFHERSSQC